MTASFPQHNQQFPSQQGGPKTVRFYTREKYAIIEHAFIPTNRILSQLVAHQTQTRQMKIMHFCKHQKRAQPHKDLNIQIRRGKNNTTTQLNLLFKQTWRLK